MAEMLSRYLIPPNVKFLFKGEVRRTLYIIRKGSIGVLYISQYNHTIQSTLLSIPYYYVSYSVLLVLKLYDEVSKDPEYIMESSGHFGLRDL
jgi:hypothetical protein